MPEDSPLPVAEIQAALEWDFSAVLGERYTAFVSIGPQNDPIVLSCPSQPNRHALQTDKPIAFQLHHLLHGVLLELEMEPTRAKYWAIQPLPDGSYCWAQPRSNIGDKNSHILNSEGQRVCSWETGDGIEDIQASPDGHIWISYFDQGVMSGSPLSESGLNCFTPTGEHVYAFSNPSAEDRCYMVDCYALNVASNWETWLCYYTGFPVVRLRNKQFDKTWPCIPQMVGTIAFAVSYDYLLFAGGYHYRNQFFWHDLNLNRTIELIPRKPDGSRLVELEADERIQYFGRGPKLYSVLGHCLWSVSVEEFWPD